MVHLVPRHRNIGEAFSYLRDDFVDLLILRSFFAESNRSKKGDGVMK